jgi:hypothetical protein
VHVKRGDLKLPVPSQKAERLVLHIGHAKTGTTTLQTTLQNSHKTLLKNNILHVQPAIGNGNARELTPLLMDPDAFSDARLKRWGQTRKQTKISAHNEWQKIIDNVAKYSPETLVISSESFFRPLHDECEKTLRKTLHSVAENVELVAYIRSPQSHFLSLFQQRLKDRSRPKVNPAPTNRFRRILGPFSQLFPGALSLNVFAKSELTDGDIVTDFSKKYLPNAPIIRLSRPSKNRNVSLSTEAMSVLQDINLGELATPIPRKKLPAVIRKFDAALQDPTRPVLHEHVAAAIVDHSFEDVMWIRDEFGLIFPDVDYDKLKASIVGDKPLNYLFVKDICAINVERKNQIIETVLRSGNSKTMI